MTFQLVAGAGQKAIRGRTVTLRFVPSMAAPPGCKRADVAAAGTLGLGGAVVESTPTAAVVGVDTIGDVERVDEMA